MFILVLTHKIYVCSCIVIFLTFEFVQKEGEEVHFLKVHAPYEVLTRYAEILKVRMPVKKVGTNK